MQPMMVVVFGVKKWMWSRRRGLSRHPWGGSDVEHYCREAVIANLNLLKLTQFVRKSSIQLKSVALKSSMLSSPISFMAEIVLNALNSTNSILLWLL